MEVEVDEKELKAAGAELLSDGRHGLHIHGWEIETRKRSILNSSTHELYAIISFLIFQCWFSQGICDVRVVSWLWVLQVGEKA